MITDARTIRVALVTALGLGIAATARAEGEDEGFSFHPSIRATTVFDDQPGLERAGVNDEAEVGFWLFPRAEVGYRSPEVHVGADLGLELRRYIDQDTLADEFVHASAFGEASLLPGLTARLSDAYVPQYRQLGLPEDHGGNLAQTNRLEGELRYWHEVGSGSELEVGGRGSHFLSETFPAWFPGAGGPIVDPSYRADFWQAAGFTQLRIPAGKDTSALLIGEAGFRDYDDRLRSDHWNVAAMAGLRSERFENLELELVAGYGRIEFDSLGTVQQPIGRLRLRQRLPHGFAWHGLAANRFRSNLAGNEVFEATGEIGLEKQLVEHTDASVDLFLAHFQDRGVPANLYGGVEVEVGRDLAAQARLSLAYRHWRNAGDASFDDLTQNSIYLRLSLRR